MQTDNRVLSHLPNRSILYNDMAVQCQAAFTHNVGSTRGTAVAQWLRCCATNWKVAGSIPDGVTGIFH